MSLKSTTPIADLHTPEQLLDNAETLFAYKNPKTMRAAVLEAITALESYVQSVVFPSLSEKLDPVFVQWLEEKTKMDFDARLSVLTPVAIGQSVDKHSILWTDYKRAKEIRNKVTHSGQKVSPTDARFVIDTVYKWLAYLGSTAELELSLLNLKSYIEENSIKITSEHQAISLIADYFGKTKASMNSQEVPIPFGTKDLRADLILKYGSFTTLVETKFFSPNVNVRQMINGILERVKAYLTATGITQGAVIIFQKGGNPSEFSSRIYKYYGSVGESKQNVVYALIINV